MDKDQTNEPIDNKPAIGMPPDVSPDNNTQSDAIAPTEPIPENSEPTSPTEPAKPQKNNKPLIIVLIVLLLAALGAVAYLLLSQPKPDNRRTQTDTSETEEDEEEEEEEEEEKEDEEEAVKTTIEDQATISSLFEKLLILHHPQVKDFLTNYGDNNYIENQYFSFGSTYSVNDSLYSNGLTNSDKFFITTEYMRGEGQLNPAQNYGIPSDFYSSSPYCVSNPTNTYCSNIDWIKAASEDEVAASYAKIFGDKPSKFEKPTNDCGALTYDQDYHIYYMGMSNCGGGEPLPHQVYIEQYTKNEKNSYIYVRIATIVNMINEKAPVYKTYISLDELYDENRNINLNQDPSLIYNYLESASIGVKIPRIITTDNYTEFEPYRFVFGKDADGNYFFKTVEKL